MPKFEHQLHDGDPRVRRLYHLAQSLVDEGKIPGTYLNIAEQYRKALETDSSNPPFGRKVGKRWILEEQSFTLMASGYLEIAKSR